jgi:hypothetical protein
VNVKEEYWGQAFDPIKMKQFSEYSFADSSLKVSNFEITDSFLEMKIESKSISEMSYFVKYVFTTEDVIEKTRDSKHVRYRIKYCLNGDIYETGIVSDGNCGGAVYYQNGNIKVGRFTNVWCKDI